MEQQNMDIQKIKKNFIKDTIILTRHVQEHMLRTYIKSIQHASIKEDAIKNKKIKGSPTGKK
eukprot:5941671-Heterocapsa_arctica.AAC.1